MRCVTAPEVVAVVHRIGPLGWAPDPGPEGEAPWCRPVWVRRALEDAAAIAVERPLGCRLCEVRSGHFEGHAVLVGVSDVGQEPFGECPVCNPGGPAGRLCQFEW